MTKKTLIIAEAGVNHNGKLDLAYQLCDKAKEAGADVVKFQTWQTDKIVTRTAEMAKYQTENLSHQDTQYAMLKRLELSFEQFRLIKKHCEEIGIAFLSTSDMSSLSFLLEEVDQPWAKIGSGDLTNIPYLRAIGAYNKPVILSTGMGTLAQVDTAYNTLLQAGAPKVSLLHCTTNYPCPMNEVNLRAMLTLRDAFKCQVGYSDHTMGIEIPVAAVAMGAEIIEKHFTLDRNMEGPDHIASIEPHEFKLMVEKIRNVESALGDGIKRPNRSEEEISSVVLKRIVASKNIMNGTKFTADNITVKRSNIGYPASYWDIILGSQARRDYKVDEAIEL